MNKKEKSEEEPKTKLYRLTISEDIEAESIEEARKVAPVRLRNLEKAKIEESISRVTRAKYSSRADRLSQAESLISEAKGIVEDLKGEIEEWHGNLPENLQNSEKGNALEECAQNLEELESALEEAEGNCGSVEFPGMY